MSVACLGQEISSPRYQSGIAHSGEERHSGSDLREIDLGLPSENAEKAGVLDFDRGHGVCQLTSDGIASIYCLPGQIEKHKVLFVLLRVCKDTHTRVSKVGSCLLLILVCSCLSTAMCYKALDT